MHRGRATGLLVARHAQRRAALDRKQPPIEDRSKIAAKAAAAGAVEKKT